MIFQLSNMKLKLNWRNDVCQINFHTVTIILQILRSNYVNLLQKGCCTFITICEVTGQNQALVTICHMPQILLQVIL